MKNIITISVLLFGLSLFVNAQTVVFQDDFETFEHGTSMVGVGYAVWEGTAFVNDTEADPGLTAFSGNKLVICTGTASKTFYLRKTVSLVEGKSYTLTIATKAIAAKPHRIGYRFPSATAAVVLDLVSNTDWVEHTVDFTATVTEDLTFWVQYFGTGNVHVDKIVLSENITSNVSLSANDDFKLVPTVETGIFSVLNTGVINSVRIFDLKGQMIQQANGNIDYINLSNSPDGIYIVKIENAEGKLQSIKVAKN